MILLRQLFKSKRGSTIVIISYVFLALISMIIIAIGIARSRTVQSWSEVSGKLWGKAILSEYDKYLLHDYGIMAFQSNDIDVVMYIQNIPLRINFALALEHQVQT